MNKINKKLLSKTTLVLGCLFFMLFALLLVWNFEVAYTDKIYPGVRVASVALGGLSKQEALETLDNALEQYVGKSATFFVNGVQKSIPFQSTPSNPDIPVIETFDFNRLATVEDALRLGRNGTLFQNLYQKKSALFFGKNIPLRVSVDNKTVQSALDNEFKEFISSSTNASFEYDSENKILNVLKETNGTGLDHTTALAHMEKQASELSLAPIIISLQEINATVTQKQLELLLPQAQSLISKSPIILNIDQKKWKIYPKEIASWMTYGSNDSVPFLTFDYSKIEGYLTKKIADEVFINPENPQFQIKDGKLFITSRGKNGAALDVTKSAQLIASALSQSEQAHVQLAMQELTPPLISAQTNATFELLADEMTDFKGSPNNRKKNIAHGMDKMNGAVIPAGEEFSLIKYLGEIDETNGFLPELVIKGKETKPEFGGGLCQVSTTLFRSVTKAGLPILERRNHSYRVSYYEPPIGFDATIYFPKPDFRFENDTKGPILIQAGVAGTKARVQLWGTKDERRIEIDEPIVTNIRKPGPIKIVETDKLKPGEKKCIEKAHSGADAYLERRVFYPDGTTKKDGFKSHYVVWPAVCLVGKRETTASTPETSSEKPLNETATQDIAPQTEPVPIEQQSQSANPLTNSQ